MFRTSGLLCLAVIANLPGLAVAQDLMATMRTYTDALGVTCDYCHSAPRGSGLPEPKKNVARAMAVMTRDLNAKVMEATGKEAALATRVECVTCHRGVSIPKPLIQLLNATVAAEGVPVALKQYEDLRARYYGRAAYDFGEDTLIAVARRIVEIKPMDAVAVLQTELKYFPNSSAAYEALGYAYTRRSNDAEAIQALEKAVELDPTNAMARGRLEQLKAYRRR